MFIFFLYCDGNHRDLHVLTHAFPTRRSSDLRAEIERDLGLARKRIVIARLAIEDGRIAAQPARRKRRRHDAVPAGEARLDDMRSEEHTSELQSLMRISYAVFCLKKKKPTQQINRTTN